MQEAARALRAWVEATRLTAGRVTGSLILEIGRRFEFALQPLHVIRPADLLVLEFRFVNFRREGARLVRSDAAKPAYLIAIHQPQSFGEEAFHEIGDQTELADDKELDGLEEPPPVPARVPDPKITQGVPAQAKIRIAGPSRVAYKMPAEVDGIDRTLDALLRACRRWPLSLDGNAQLDAGDFRFEGSIDLEWMAGYLRDVALVAWTALESASGPAARRALDDVAAGLADDALAAIAAGRGADDGRALRTRADSGVRRVIPSRAGDESVRVDQALAALYVRAQASREALTRVQRTPDRDPFVLSRLPPDIFIGFLTPHLPSERETAIEMPYRLIGSPLATAGFAHASQPVTHKGRTELWHSRLGTRETRNGLLQIDDRPGVPTETGGWDGEKLRFLWSPDYPEGTPLSFNQPLDYLDRRMLVKLTAGFDELQQDEQTPFVPRAVFVRRLMLSAMGGDLEAHRKFDPRPMNVDISAWTHRSAIGRDYYVRVEYSGFLFPFGHRATLVKLTERKFQWRALGDRVAALRQRFFIIVRDKMIAYPGAAPQPHDGRSFPFEQVICALEGATPDLDVPGAHPDDRLPTTVTPTVAERRMAFWPSRGGGVDYKFPLVGIDGAGRKIPFEMPLIFISELKNTAAAIPLIRNHWNGPGKPAARRIPTLAGQTVRMAPATEGSNVDVPLNETEIRAFNPTGALSPTPARTLQQFPRFGDVKAKLAAIERLTGVARVETIKFFDPYLTGGLNSNGAVFAELVDAAKLGFGSDTPSSNVGGIATPDLTPSGLSARYGVTSGNVATFNSGNFDPGQFFPDAKLLGFFSLSTLLRPLPLNKDFPETPRITTVEEVDRIRTTFTIVQTLASGEPITGLILGAGGSQSEFTLEALVDAPLAGAAPETSVTGTLTNFKISFLGALIIHFDRLRFFTRPGAKPDVDVDLNPQSGVTFGGPLEFINRLKDFIPANGFSDPPNLDVTPAGITAGYSLGLPAIQVGIMSLSNISLGAAFSLPFTGEPPTARFNFAERQNTFNLTVSMFGGGGFVALVATAEKIKEIEAQLDFGAQIAINLGVASGSVYVKGGFYFHYATDKVEFEGFVELGGRLSVLGLISVSLTFHLGLTYELLQKSGNNGIRASRLFGQATLTVEIDILFFSASVEVSVEKTFIGSEADPTFLDLVPQKALWDEYCAAYA